ncbi:concanavalin A-like lectin/glucanase domain-containing protein [Xylaria sp. CBS 124048]|nr:concanavalin A-like lectin/glucanase domain-containing protein [Xylaria sp. CBS 124048]
MLSQPRSGPAFALLTAALLSPAAGQLSTKCNPMLADCPPDPALGTAHTFFFNSTPADGLFTSEANPITFDEKNGATFIISEKGNAPTLASDFYFFFGRTEVLMKAAPGQGIISSIVWGSDTLDEVDWEFKGGNDTFVFTNYFGKGDTNDTSTGGQHQVSGTIYDLHNYTSVWTAEKLEWHLDGNLIRTLIPSETDDGGTHYPQTPMTLRMGSWVGGDPTVQAPGTVEWAGGPTDFTKGPFTMYVESARVEDYSSGKEYQYTNRNGTWQSINVIAGNSTVAETINKPPPMTLADRWNALPQGARTGVYAAAGIVGGVGFLALAFYYFKQRRSGKREAALAAKMQEEERVELDRFQKSGINPDGLNFGGTAYLGAAGKLSKGGSYTPLVDSPPGSSAGPAEKTWDPMGSHDSPLLPSPIRTQSSGVPPSFPPPMSPNRGFSQSSMGGVQNTPYTDAVDGHPGSPQARSPGSPAPHDLYGMSRNSPGPAQMNQGPGSPGPQNGFHGNFR